MGNPFTRLAIKAVVAINNFKPQFLGIDWYYVCTIDKIYCDILNCWKQINFIIKKALALLFLLISSISFLFR